MKLTVKILKDRIAPGILLYWADKKFRKNPFTMEDAVLGLHKMPVELCWLLCNLLEQKKGYTIAIKCVEKVITEKTPPVKKIIQKAKAWCNRSSEVTEKGLASLADGLYKDLEEIESPKLEGEYIALMELAAVPGYMKDPDCGRGADDVLNALANAVSINRKREVDLKQRLRAYEVFAEIAVEQYRESSKKKVSTKNKSSSVAATLKYLEGLGD